MGSPIIVLLRNLESLHSLILLQFQLNDTIINTPSSLEQKTTSQASTPYPDRAKYATAFRMQWEDKAGLGVFRRY